MVIGVWRFVGLNFAGYDIDKDEEPAEDDEWETEADFVVRDAASIVCSCFVALLADPTIQLLSRRNTNTHMTSPISEIAPLAWTRSGQ